MEKKDTLSSCSDSEIQQMQLIQDKSKESCMVSFQRLHSHSVLLSKQRLKRSRNEEGFKRAFAHSFGQDLIKRAGYKQQIPGNDAHVVDADIRTIMLKSLMAEYNDC
ncbi:hypothetical protein Tco_0568135 [Tanacetum coccineum]